MELLKEYKEYLLLTDRKSYRTMMAYGKHVEDFLMHLHSKFGELEVGLTTNHEMQVYLLNLRSKCISTPIYTQVVSALGNWCSFLNDRYQVAGLSVPEGTIIASFPIACSESRILEIMHSLQNTFEGIRMKLIIRLLYIHKLTLSELVSCKRGLSEKELICNKKQITLGMQDQLLLKLYIEELASYSYKTDTNDHLFIAKIRSSAVRKLT